jgi:hypothetical protein
VIIRVTHGRVVPNGEASAFEILRKASAEVPRPDGLEAFLIGRRQVASSGVELIAITAWRDMDSLVTVMGPTWQVPTWLPGLEKYVVAGTLEHYETVAEDFEGIRTIGLDLSDLEAS